VTTVGDTVNTRWLYCVECPQHSTRLEALGYLCDCLCGRPKITSGQSNLAYIRRIAAVDRWFSVIRQVMAMCPLPGPAAINNILRVCHNFHPNRFTSGGVIAERVNTVKTCHKHHAAFASDFRIRAQLRRCIRQCKM